MSGNEIQFPNLENAVFVVIDLEENGFRHSQVVQIVEKQQRDFDSLTLRSGTGKAGARIAQAFAFFESGQHLVELRSATAIEMSLVQRDSQAVHEIDASRCAALMVETGDIGHGSAFPSY